MSELASNVHWMCCVKSYVVRLKYVRNDLFAEYAIIVRLQLGVTLLERSVASEPPPPPPKFPRTKR
eukprot:2115798-Amphidinium_carterae.1